MISRVVYGVSNSLAPCTRHARDRGQCSTCDSLQMHSGVRRYIATVKKGGDKSGMTSGNIITAYIHSYRL